MIPNTRLREGDEEMFDMNWLEFVRRDTEGSDTDTRRRASRELVRALVDKFPAEVRRRPKRRLRLNVNIHSTRRTACACEGSLWPLCALVVHGCTDDWTLLSHQH